MRIGIPREIKDNEYRVGMVPGGVRTMVDAGHQVMVERGAGVGSAIADDEYVRAGASLGADADEVWRFGDMIVKVKEPVAPEYGRMRDGQLLFTYLHLAPVPELTQALLDRQVTGIAYETIPGRGGTLPLLSPMSEVAGRMAVQVGATCLQKPEGGRGVLLGGVPGVPPADVVILGGGIVGLNAAKMAVGMGASVTLLERDIDRMRYLDDVFGGRLVTLASNPHNLEAAVARCDLLIGAVLIPGAAAPKLVSRAMLGLMKKGTVLVDVAVDQGGCFETTRPTTHSNPTYEVDGIVHYCVANMPGAVPRTSTFALTNATFPYALALASRGFAAAVREVPGILEGVNVHRGHITYRAVAESQGRSHTPFAEIS